MCISTDAEQTKWYNDNNATCVIGIPTDERRITHSFIYPVPSFLCTGFQGKRTGFICTLPILYSFILFLITTTQPRKNYDKCHSRYDFFWLFLFCAIQIIGQIIRLSFVFCILYKLPSHYLFQYSWSVQPSVIKKLVLSIKQRRKN